MKSVKFQDKCWLGSEIERSWHSEKSTRITLTICAYRTEMPHFIHIWAIKSIVNHFVMSVFYTFGLNDDGYRKRKYPILYCFRVQLQPNWKKQPTTRNFLQVSKTSSMFFRVPANEYLSHFKLIYVFSSFSLASMKTKVMLNHITAWYLSYPLNWFTQGKTTNSSEIREGM